MRILYVDHYVGSLSMGMEFRPYYMAREWQKLGHTVRFIGADYSHLRIKQPTVEKDFQIEEIDGEVFQWIKTIQYNGNGSRRAISIFQFVSKLWLAAPKIAKEFKPDVVISSSTYPLDSYPCKKLARIAKAKYIHEAHDMWPATLIEMGGMSKKHPFVRLMAIAEKYAYSNSDKIISVLPATLQHMLNHGLSGPDKFAYIPNGIVPEDWGNPETLDKEHQDGFDKLRGKFIVGYLGGHALTNALSTFIDAAVELKNISDVVFVLVGKGVEKQKLVDRAQKEGLKNVVFFPPVKKTQVPTALQNMDVLYIGAGASSLYRYGISMNKIYDYMMSGKPIIYGIKAANNEIEEAGCGITIKPESSKELVEAIRHLKDMNINKREELGARGKKWVLENRRYETLAKKFLKEM